VFFLSHFFFVILIKRINLMCSTLNQQPHEMSATRCTLCKLHFRHTTATAALDFAMALGPCEPPRPLITIHLTHPPDYVNLVFLAFGRQAVSCLTVIHWENLA